MTGDILEKALPIVDGEELQQLFGPYDRNLKAVKSSTGIDIYVRDGKLCFRGESKRLHRAMKVFKEMKEIVAVRGQVSEEDLSALLAPSSTTGSGADFPLGKVFRREASIKALSDGQEEYLEAVSNNDIVFAIGPAGTGKTYLAVAKAVEALQAGIVRRMVLVRPAVEAGERLGFLPGDIQAKVNPYLRPIYDSLNSFLEFGQLQRLIDGDVVEIVPLAFMRGRTLDEAFIILDEAQNTTSDQMKMFLTRMGSRSKIVVTGDITQTDLPQGKRSGLSEVRELLLKIPGIEFVYLGKNDIVRHPLVQRIVDAYDQIKRRR
jgi:phosphate starvation-inducible PhoH-like protein